MLAISHVTSSNTDTRRAAASLAPRPALVSRRANDWPRRTALVVALFLAVVTLWLLRSLWVPLILASWFAIVARPAHKWLSARMGGHRRAASLFTLLLVLGCLLPIAVTVLSLAGDAIELVRQIAASPDAFQALKQLVAGPNPGGQEASKDFTTYSNVFSQRQPILTQVYSCRMPPEDEPRPTDAQRATLLTWLVCGSPNN